MIDLREKLEAFCVELKAMQKTLKKAGKSRKKETLTDVRKLMSETADSLDKAIAAVDPERLCKPGVPKHKFDEMVETSCCYKCGCRQGLLIQWLSPNTGRALRRFSVVCANCWNLTVRESCIGKAVSENNKFNKTFHP